MTRTLALLCLILTAAFAGGAVAGHPVAAADAAGAFARADAPDVAARSGSAPRALNDLFGGVDSNEPELLAPEVAYVPVVTHASPDRVEVLWRIEPGYYLYRDKTTLALDGADGALAGTPRLDEGTIQHDDFFGDVAVWREEALMVLPLAPPATPGGEATLEVSWQGCADIGVCFPPKKSLLKVVFDDDAAARPAGDEDPLASLAAIGAGAGGSGGGSGGGSVGGSSGGAVTGATAGTAAGAPRRACRCSPSRGGSRVCSPAVACGSTRRCSSASASCSRSPPACCR